MIHFYRRNGTGGVELEWNDKFLNKDEREDRILSLNVCHPRVTYERTDYSKGRIKFYITESDLGSSTNFR